MLTKIKLSKQHINPFVHVIWSWLLLFADGVFNICAFGDGNKSICQRLAEFTISTLQP